VHSEEGEGRRMNKSGPFRHKSGPMFEELKLRHAFWYRNGMTGAILKEYMTMIGSHENRKSQNGELKKPPMLFLNLCTNMDLEK
jgi:hypothetical protein